MKFLIIYFSLICFYIIQRLFELVLNKKNEKILKTKYHAIEANKSDSIRMKLLHVFWFISFILEAFCIHNIISDNLLILILIILFVCQLIRFHTINLLKEFWTIKIYKMDKQDISQNGLYKIIRHPNYLAVIIELFLIPLIFKAYITAFVFSIINFFVLKKRILLEESVLISQSDYLLKFNKLNRLIPFIF